MKIVNNDIVSGAFYNKLLKDYKKYDKRQKKIIQALQYRVEELESLYACAIEEIEFLNDLIEEDQPRDYSLAKYRCKIKNQRMVIKTLYQKLQREGLMGTSTDTLTDIPHIEE